MVVVYIASGKVTLSRPIKLDWVPPLMIVTELLIVCTFGLEKRDCWEIDLMTNILANSTVHDLAEARSKCPMTN